MIASTATNQIIAALEQGMTCEEIAEDCGYDIVAVKSVALSQQSAKKTAFKLTDPLAVGTSSEEPLNHTLFSADDLTVARNAIVELVSTAEMEGVKLKAATFIINEVKGRNNIAKSLVNGDFDIAVINAAMERAREAMRRTREAMANKKAIEV